MLKDENKATVFGYYVSDPERYGVAEFNDNGDVISIEVSQNQTMQLLDFTFTLLM